MNKLAAIRQRTGPFGTLIVTAYMVLGSYGVVSTFHNFGPLGGIALLAVSFFTAFIPAAAAGMLYAFGYLF